MINKLGMESVSEILEIPLETLKILKKTHKPKHSRYMKKKTIKLYLKSFSINQISEKINIPNEDVEEIIKKYENAKAIQKNDDPQVTETINLLNAENNEKEENIIIID